MTTPEQALQQVLRELQARDIPHMLVGAYSSNFYGIARSTNDADLVVDVADASTMRLIHDALEPILDFSSQLSFESLTGTVRHEAIVRDIMYRIEFFELGGDSFEQARFARRSWHQSKTLDCEICIPSAEDVIIQKLRWARPKDIEDARNVLLVQAATLDFRYITMWCETLGISQRFKQLQQSLTDPI